MDRINDIVYDPIEEAEEEERQHKLRVLRQKLKEEGKQHENTTENQ